MAVNLSFERYLKMGTKWTRGTLKMSGGGSDLLHKFSFSPSYIQTNFFGLLCENAQS